MDVKGSFRGRESSRCQIVHPVSMAYYTVIYYPCPSRLTDILYCYTVGFLASECVGVALSSNQGNSPLRSENTGFHFALTSAKLPALRSVETPTPNPCEVRECSLFLEVTFVISNHRITYNSMLATS